jgi:hypothetical protein
VLPICAPRFLHRRANTASGPTDEDPATSVLEVVGNGAASEQMHPDKNTRHVEAQSRVGRFLAVAFPLVIVAFVGPPSGIRRAAPCKGTFDQAYSCREERPAPALSGPSAVPGKTPGIFEPKFQLG